MKDKFKKIAGNGLPWGLAFFGLSFMLGYYNFKVPLDKSLWMAVLIGVAALIVNGLVYSRFSKPLKDLENISIEINNRESLLLCAPANHMVEDSLVPGKLFLTNRRIIFKPHPTHALSAQLFSWDLIHIKPTGFSGSLWNSGGEFFIKTKDEASLVFEVDKLKVWKEAFRYK